MGKTDSVNSKENKTEEKAKNSNVPDKKGLQKQNLFKGTDKDKSEKSSFFRNIFESVGFGKKSGNRDLREGDSLIKKSEYKKAIISFQNALREDAHCVEAHNGIARAFLAKGGVSNANLAIQQLEISLRKDPFQFKVYQHAAEIYEKLGKKKKAAAQRKKMYTAKAIKSQPDNPIANNNMGVLCLDQGDYKSAIKYFRKAILYDRNYEIAYYNMAKSWFFKAIKDKESLVAKKSLGNSWETLEKIVAEFGNKAEICLLKAKICNLKEDYERALDFCSEAYKLDPAMKAIFATKQVAHEGLENMREATIANQDYQSLEQAEKEEKKKERKEAELAEQIK